MSKVLVEIRVTDKEEEVGKLIKDRYGDKSFQGERGWLFTSIEIANEALNLIKETFGVDAFKVHGMGRELSAYRKGKIGEEGYTHCLERGTNENI